MRVWRCTHAQWADDAFSGEGARITDGRWHLRGARVVYASETAALAALEQAVNLDSIQDVMRLCRLIPADVPDELVMDVGELPQGWDAYPHPASTQQIGDAWHAAGASVALRVPSSIVVGYNVLLNPAHDQFAAIRVRTDQAVGIASSRAQ